MSAVKPVKFAAKWALAYAVYLLILQLILPLMGIHTDQNQEIERTRQLLVYALNYIPFFLLIYFVQKKYSDSHQFFAYYQRFSAGFTAVGFAAIFSGVLLLIYYRYFSHELFENMKKAALTNAGDDVMRIESAKKMVGFVPFLYFVGNTFFTVLTGIVLSIFSAALFKNKP